MGGPLHNNESARAAEGESDRVLPNTIAVGRRAGASMVEEGDTTRQGDQLFSPHAVSCTASMPQRACN